MTKIAVRFGPNHNTGPYDSPTPLHDENLIEGHSTTGLSPLQTRKRESEKEVYSKVLQRNDQNFPEA